MKKLFLIAMFPVLFAVNGLAEIGLPAEPVNSCQSVILLQCKRVLYRDVKDKGYYFDQPPVNNGPIYQKHVKDKPGITDETSVLILF